MNAHFVIRIATGQPSTCILTYKQKAIFVKIHEKQVNIIFLFKKNLLPVMKTPCLLQSHKPSTFVGGKI